MGCAAVRGLEESGGTRANAEGDSSLVSDEEKWHLPVLEDPGAVPQGGLQAHGRQKNCSLDQSKGAGHHNDDDGGRGRANSTRVTDGLTKKIPKWEQLVWYVVRLVNQV